ncbi:MAG: glycosyltransferase, partial [Pseudomonadales bacterium]|nr:glycosyltransferase [Pseudomonadales bacterium]
MNVIHVITGLSIGGAERALYNLLQGGLTENFDNYVISLSSIGTIGALIESLGVPVIALDMPVGKLTLTGVIKLHRTIHKLQPDLIQGWMYHGNLAATFSRFLISNKTALVWNVRQSLYQIENEKWLTQLVIRATRFLSKSPDTILYNSHLSRQQHEQFGFYANNGQVIPNGIDLERFCFSDIERQRVRAELDIQPDVLIVGHVARLHPMKDHPLFLNSAIDLGLRHNNVHFMLIGRDVTFDNKNLEKQISTTLTNRFHLLGERGDVAALMSSMDIFCQSSWSEAFPNVLGEAVSAKLPCVATDVGDSALILGDCGVIVKPRDKIALTAGIESLLILSANERQLFGERARKRIKENYALGAI